LNSRSVGMLFFFPWQIKGKDTAYTWICKGKARASGRRTGPYIRPYEPGP
jgi:hypothetical protein